MNEHHPEKPVPNNSADEEGRTIIYRETSTMNPWAVVALMTVAVGLIALLVSWKTGAIRFEKPNIPALQAPASETSGPVHQLTSAVGGHEMSDEERLRRLFEKLKATLLALQE